MKRGIAMTRVSMLVLTAAALAFASASAPANAADAACVKKEQAKGVSACIAKAKCDGITSRKEQAKRCS